MGAQRSRIDSPWILLVVADRDTRETLTINLKPYLAGVMPAESADEALRGLEAILPDIIVADIHPDGIQMLERVRALPRERGGSLPAIALVGRGPEEEARALKAGFVLQLRKPVNPDALLDAIELVAGGSLPFSGLDTPSGGGRPAGTKA